MVEVRPFQWHDWRALWQLRYAQLAEQGIHLDPDDIPARNQSVSGDDYEPDLRRIEQVYLSGAGGFWLAWQGETPVGMVGAQDLGGVVELRRMQVHAHYRRQGIGCQLVQTLIEHCKNGKVTAIELWTDRDGPGRFLYCRFGFRRVDGPGHEFHDVDRATGRSPNTDEIRMRLEPSSAVGSC
jgi:GNAT superfamily N-acetyltransferase